MTLLDDVLQAAGDPSIPLALAALVREADDDGRADFAQFAAAFRSEVQVALAQDAGAMPELSSDEVHVNLTASFIKNGERVRLEVESGLISSLGKLAMLASKQKK